VTHRPLPRLTGPALLAWVVTLSCQAGSERQLSREGHEHAPSDHPIAWLASDRVLFLHLDQWSADPNAVQVSCDSSGVYELDPSGRTRPLRLGEQVCEVPDANGADVSPDGRYLVYLSGEQLHRLDLETGRRITLTGDGFRWAGLPSWSPAGQRIAFVAHSSQRDSTDGPALYLVNSGGGAIRQVRSLGARYVESSPSWSPDGRRLVITAYPDGGRQPESAAEIVVVDTLGQSWRVVGAGHQASWSPTGEWIAYLAFSRVADDTSRTWASSIRLVKADGTGHRELYRTTEQTAFGRFRDRTLNGSPFGRLVWSPDGERLAFRRVFNGRSTMWAIGVDGTGLTELGRIDVGTGERRSQTNPGG